MAIRIIIGDDDPLTREALGLIFGRDPAFEVLALAADGEEAVRACLSREADVALLDIKMPRLDGIGAAAKIRAGSKCRVLLLSTFNDPALAKAALGSGASGYILKGCLPEEIKEAVRMVGSGHTVFKDEVFESVRGGAPLGALALGDLSPLTDRERDLARLIAEGCSNKEAADSLGLSEGTVKNYVSSILDKLGLRQRTQIAVYYVTGRKTFD